MIRRAAKNWIKSFVGREIVKNQEGLEYEADEKAI